MTAQAFIRGASAAAKFMGVSAKTLRSWMRDPAVSKRELLAPRIIRGDAYYSAAKLTQFMDAQSNAKGARTEVHFA